MHTACTFRMCWTGGAQSSFHARLRIVRRSRNAICALNVEELLRPEDAQLHRLWRKTFRVNAINKALQNRAVHMRMERCCRGAPNQLRPLGVFQRAHMGLYFVPETGPGIEPVPSHARVLHCVQRRLFDGASIENKAPHSGWGPSSETAAIS